LEKGGFKMDKDSGDFHHDCGRKKEKEEQEVNEVERK